MFSILYVFAQNIRICFHFHFPDNAQFCTNLKKKCKFIITCKTHQSGLWESWNYGDITTLQKHYHYYYESQAKIRNIMEIEEQLQQSEQLYIVVVHTV